MRDGPKLDEKQTIATVLQRTGYRTGLFGKYLNNYPFGRGPYTPPGWNEFIASVGADDYYDYKLNENGRVVSYSSQPRDYKTDVLARMSRKFIRATNRRAVLPVLGLQRPARRFERAGSPTT